MCDNAGFVRVTLAEHHHFHTFVQVYKISHHLIPAYLQDNTFKVSKDFTRFVGTNNHHFYSFLECGLLMDKRVYCMEGW